MKTLLILLFFLLSNCIIDENSQSPDFLPSDLSENDLSLLGDSPVLPGVWHIADGLDILSFRQMAPVFAISYVIEY